MSDNDRVPIIPPDVIVGGGWQKPTAPPIASQAQVPGLPPLIRQLSPVPPKLAVSPPTEKD